MVKVCHVTSAHQRYDGRIFRKECTSLAKAGYTCYLIVNDDKPDEIKNSVHIVSTGLLIKSRKERFLKSHKYLYEKMEMVSADIYHFHDPDLLSLAYKTKKNGKKVIFDFHENVSEQIKDKKWLPSIFRKSVSSLYKKYEHHYVTEFDALITVSPNIGEYYRKLNFNTEIITNYPIIEKSYIEPTFDDKNICFCGGISEQWCHDTILDSIEKIDECNYILAGKGSKTYLDSLKEKPGWEKVKYLGMIPFEKVAEIYQKSMAGLALNVSTQIGKEGSLGNTKLFEYMLAGIPVICSDNRLWKEIITKYKCGIVVDPLNKKEIVTAIQSIFLEPEKAREMGKSGRRAVLKYFNWSVEEKKLCNLYQKLALR